MGARQHIPTINECSDSGDLCLLSSKVYHRLHLHNALLVLHYLLLHYLLFFRRTYFVVITVLCFRRFNLLAFCVSRYFLLIYFISPLPFDCLNLFTFALVFTVIILVHSSAESDQFPFILNLYPKPNHSLFT